MGKNNQYILSRENKGTERDTPSLGLGICLFQLSYFQKRPRTEECSPRRPHKGKARSDAVDKRKRMANDVEISFVDENDFKNKRIGIFGP